MSDKKNTTPGNSNGKRSGYPEPQPRDGHDARNRGKRPHDPDEGGLDRTPGDDPDPAGND